MKIFKKIGISLLFFFLLLIIFWAGSLAFLQTDQGKEWAYRKLTAYLEKTFDADIQVEGFEFSRSHLHLDKLTISQEQKPLLVIKSLGLHFAYSHLLQGKIVIPSLKISSIDLIGIPETKSLSTPGSIACEGASLLPVYIKLENIEFEKIQISPQILNRLELSPQLLKMAAGSSLELKGKMANNPFMGSFIAHLLLKGFQEEQKSPLFSLGIDADHRQLSFSLHLPKTELQPFLASRLPIELKGNGAFFASAPLSTWNQLFYRSTLEQPIEGHFKASLHLAENEIFDSSLTGEEILLKGRYSFRSNEEIELIHLNIETAPIIAEGSGTIDTYLQVHEGLFIGEVKDLHRFEKLIGKKIDGKISFDGSLSGFALSPHLKLSVESPSLSLAEKTIDRLKINIDANPSHHSWKGFLNFEFHQEDNSLKGESLFEWNRENTIQLSDLRLDTANSHLAGKIQFTLPEFLAEGVFDSHFDNFKDFSHFVDFALNGEGQSQITLTINEDSSEQKIQSMAIKFQGSDLHWTEGSCDQLSCDLRIPHFSLEQKNLQGDSMIEGKNIRWKDMSLEHCAANLTGDFDYVRQSFSSLSAEWQGNKLLMPAGHAKIIQGKAILDHLQKGSILVELQHLETPQIDLAELAFSTRLNPGFETAPFTLNGKGISKEPFAFSAEGDWQYSEESKQLEILTHRLQGYFGPYPLELKKRLSIVAGPGLTQIKDLDLQWGEGGIQADFQSYPGQLSAQFKTNALPLELLHFIDPDLPLSGRARLQGVLEGTLDHPSGQIDIQIQNVYLDDKLFAQKPMVGGEIKLAIDHQRLAFTSNLHGVGQTPFLVSGQLPIRFSLASPSFKIDRHSFFSASLQAEGKLDPYLQLFYNGVTNLSADARISLLMNGSLNEPHVQGHVELLNGTYESLKTGALYNNIHAYLEGDGSNVILKEFSARDNKQGSIEAAGSVLLDLKNHFPFEFQIKPRQMHIVDADYAQMSASGELLLKGNTLKSKLQGDLFIDEGKIHLEAALPNKFKTIDVQYINVTRGEQLPSFIEKKDPANSIELDFKLHASEPIQIEGNHIKSEWKGVVAVLGTLDNPQLHGDLRISQGEYDFNGKIFNLGQGSIHFAGSPDKKTTLYIVAGAEFDRIRADIIVKGPVARPAISFRSTPPLSQREILSYILFNRGTSDITPEQGDRLTQSFISLNSSEKKQTGDDFLTRLRNTIGLDRLDFSRSDNDTNDLGVQIGKNITENILVTVNQSMASLSPIIAIDVKLHKNVKAQAKTGIDGDFPFRTSIKWRKDY